MDIKYSITTIRKTASYIDIPADFDLKDHSNELELFIEFEFEGRKETNELNVNVVHLIYWNKHSPKEENHKVELLQLEVKNTYEVENLHLYIDEKNESFDKALVIKFSHLSASHARGIQSTITNDTPLESIYISTKKINP